jgi:SAM-dependent methyltransferase
MTVTQNCKPNAPLSKEAEIASSVYHYRLRGWIDKNPNAQVLDLGCGNGKISSFFSHHFKRVIGVDLNAQKLETAKSLGLETYCQDVFEFLETQKESFDVICAFDLVEHLGKKRIETFLALCFQNLRAQGRIIIQMPNPISPFGFGVTQGDLTHEFPLSPVLAQNLLKAAGFIDCEWRETGPALWGYSWISTLRFFCWKIFRLGFRLIHLIEAGERDNFPLTRVYLISAKKP